MPRPLNSQLGLLGTFASVATSSEEPKVQLSSHLTLIIFHALVHDQPSYVPSVARLVLPTVGTHTGLKLYVQFQGSFRINALPGFREISIRLLCPSIEDALAIPVTQVS